MIPCVGKSDSAVVFLFVCACVYNVYIICLLICSAGFDITENINDKNVFLRLRFQTIMLCTCVEFVDIFKCIHANTITQWYFWTHSWFSQISHTCMEMILYSYTAFFVGFLSDKIVSWLRLLTDQSTQNKTYKFHLFQ